MTPTEFDNAALRAEIRRLRSMVSEARRCLKYSAKELRKREGADSVLCELIEEEAFVAAADEYFGNTVETDPLLRLPA